MKILITGSKGFIGSYLYQWLSMQEGYQVWGADILPDYTDPRYLLVHAQQPDFEALFRAHGFHLCINCSGAAHVPDSFVHTPRDFGLNVANVAALLEAIRHYAPHCRFIQLGSAAVYGNPASLPVAETHPLHPLSPYGYHKWMAEQLCTEYHRLFGLQTLCLRIFSAYGPGLRKQLFWDLYQKMHASQNLQLWGTGAESRDFVFIGDIATAIGLLAEKGDFQAAVYNVGTGMETTVAQAATLMAEALGWKGRIDFGGEARPGDPNNWCADSARLQGLGWLPAVDLKHGLNQYIDWLQNA